jgi:hypothetical protein
MLKSMMDIKDNNNNKRINKIESEVVSTRVEPNAKLFTFEREIN